MDRRRSIRSGVLLDGGRFVSARNIHAQQSLSGKFGDQRIYPSMHPPPLDPWKSLWLGTLDPAFIGRTSRQSDSP